tara:strand:- start:7324 stop:7596 length:273 start_codon:yes stop_codon:yes gene_type:complete
MTDQQPQAPKPDPNELNIQDLALARAVVELATERGCFKAEELANVGALYNKLNAFLKNVEEQAKAAKEAQEQAAQAPVAQPAEEPAEMKE